MKSEKLKIVNIKKLLNLPSKLFMWRRLKRGQQRYFEISLAILLIILIPTLFFIFNNTKKAEAGWFDDAWKYRKPFSITNSTGSNQSNFQIILSFDSTTSYVTAGKMLGDCGDIRITNVNGKLLPFWVQSCNTASTKVYVWVDTIPTAGTTLYMYYGNGSARKGDVKLGSQAYPGLSCKAILDHGDSSGDGSYYIDPNAGSITDNFQAYCDMTTNSGGWTIVTAETSTGQQGLTSDTETAGNPLSFAPYNINRTKKANLSVVSTESIIKRSGGTWIKLNAALFDSSLTTASTHVHNSGTLTSSNSTSASVYYGYSNFNNSAGGDFGITQNPDGATCAGSTTNGFDHHNTTYYHLNCGCQRHYFYQYGTTYNVNTSLGDWSVTNSCASSDTSMGSWYAGLRGATAPTVANITVGSLGTEEQTNGPLAYWKLDEGQGVNANDSIFTPASLNTTNLVRNPSFETDLNNYSAPGGGNPSNITLTRDTNTSVFGSTSVRWIRTVSGGDVWFGDINATLTNSTTYTISYYARSTSASRTLSQRYATNNIGETGCPTSSITLTPAWQRITCIFTTSGSGTTNGGVILRDDNVLNDPIYLDGFQIEASNGPTVYCDGSQTGKARHDWTGTAHASTSICNNGITGTLINGPTWQNEDQCISSKCLLFDGTNDYIDVTANVSESSYTASMWIKTSCTNCGIFSVDLNALGSGGHDRHIYLSSSNICVRTWNTETICTSGTNYADNGWHFITHVFGGSVGGQRIYVDGILKVGGSKSSSDFTTQTGINIGFSNDGGAPYFKGSIDEVKVYDYARSADQIKMDYASRGSVKGVSTSLGGQGGSAGNDKLSQGLVAHLKMDETSWNGTSGEAKDASGNSVTGTAANGATITSAGKFGNAGSFDGSDDYLQTSYVFPTTNFSYAFWVKSAGNGANNRPFGAADYSAGLNGTSVLYGYPTAGQYYVVLRQGANVGTFDITASPPTSLNVGWHHIVVTVDSVAGAKTYWDGTFIASNSLAKSITTGSLQTRIGRDANQTSGGLSGNVDDARIYNRVLSPNEVEQLYNYAPPPIIYYDFNERQGTAAYNKSTTATAAATLTNGPTWVPGKYGSAVNFDGSNDYVDAGNDPSLQQSLGSLSFSAWIKPGIDVASMVNWVGIVQKYDFGGPNSNNSFGLVRWDNGSGKLIAGLYTNAGGSSTNVVTTTIFKANTWYHVAAVYNGATYKLYVNGVEEGSSTITGNLTVSNKNLLIGVTRLGSEHWTGVIDEVKVYNYARTTKQLIEDMNAGHPAAGSPVGSQVAYWKFDEGQGLIANNSTYKASGTIRNIVTNPSVEVDTTDWSLTGGHARSTEKAAFGAASIKATVSGANVASNTSCLTVSPSTAYTFSAYIYRVAGFSGNTTLDIIEYSDSGCTASVLDGPNPGTTTTNEWVRVSVNQTMNASTIRVRLRYVTDGSATGTAYFDGAQFETGSTTNIYCDGSLTGNPSHLWTGTAHASASSCSVGNDGELASPTWTTSGKFWKGLSFDGTSNKYMQALGSSPLQDVTDSSFTFSTWVRPTAIPANTDTSNQYGGLLIRTGFHMGLFYSYQQKFLFTAYNTSNTSFNATSSLTYPTGSWYHVVGVMNTADNSVKLYVNGILAGTSTLTGTLKDYATANYYVGKNTSSACSGAFVNCFTGQIDEVKIYSGALSSDEVKIDYNQGAAMVLGAFSTDPGGLVASNSASSTYCVPGDTSSCAGPVGEWNFDEGIGSIANDTSGNGNTATWSGTLGSQWNPGKVGKAGNFNGTNNYLYINVPMGSSLDIAANPVTMEAWIKSSNTTAFSSIVGRGNSGAQAGGSGYGMALSPNGNGKMNIGRFAGGNFDGNQVLANNTWYHVVGIINGASSQIWINGKLDATGTVNVAGGSTPHPAYIGGVFGAVGPNPLNVATGQIDSVKVFNYARTPAQIAWDYNRGGPVGWWKMDECQGSIVNDASDTATLSGTLIIGSGGSQTSTTNMGTCATSGTTPRYNGRNGKINSSINLDGTDDYISVPNAGLLNPSSAITLAAWVYHSGSGTWKHIVTKPSSGSWSSPFAVYSLRLVSDQPNFWVNSASNAITAPTTLATNTWYHLVGTYDGTTQKIYINGNLAISSSLSGSINSSTEPLAIGTRNTASVAENFQGQLDDIRVYNYALTPNQIKTLYNENSAVRYAPITGAP